MTNISGFVPQNDVFVEGLTVREHFYFMVSQLEEVEPEIDCFVATLLYLNIYHFKIFRAKDWAEVADDIIIREAKADWDVSDQIWFEWQHKSEISFRGREKEVEFSKRGE